MNIAIVGAGFSGLATCYHLLQSGKCQKVTLFDRQGIGSGASGMAAGLVHPYGGTKAKLSYHAEAALTQTLKLLQPASQAEQVALFTGILRPCTTHEQREHFSHCCHTDTEWWDEHKVQKTIPNLNLLPALYIRSGIAVHTMRYLQGLWKACQKMGATLEIRAIQSLKELAAFDHVISCTGAYAETIMETENLGIKKLKGQILQLEWPQDLAPLALPLISDGYLVASDKPGFCYAGATFEREFSSEVPDRKKAEEEIRKKVKAFSPLYSELAFVDCKAGLRGYTKNKLPLIARLSQKEWAISGLGSKGLLYHAWVAKLTCKAILDNTLDHIPCELCYDNELMTPF